MGYKKQRVEAVIVNKRVILCHLQLHQKPQNLVARRRSTSKLVTKSRFTSCSFSVGMLFYNAVVFLEYSEVIC